MRRKFAWAAGLGALAMVALPSSAFAQEGSTVESLQVQLDYTWVLVAAVLVLFMQAGFLFLEIGFSRQKNAGAGVAKIFVNLGIVSLVWWAVGNGIYGDGNKIFGTTGENFFFTSVAEGSGVAATDLLFAGLFCAVSLAIVWGTTLERIKFSAYVIYAIVFGAIIYPLIAHAVYSDGLLADVGGKPVMDYAGSTVVHLTGAVGGLAALLLLGPRKGKYGPDGKPRAIPGHSMPIVGLGVLILWVGWFGFNAGAGYGADIAFGEIALNTQLAAAAGVLGALVVSYAKTKAIDVGMVGNGAIAGLVAITAPCGFVEFWAAPIIGAIGGVVAVYGILAIEKRLDDPVGALSAHGLAGIWGTFAVGLFGSARLIEDGASPGLWYGVFGDEPLGATVGQLGVQTIGFTSAFIVVLVLSYITFALIKATIGLRVPAEDEEAGLDISVHGMYGYPESFIPTSETAVGTAVPTPAGTTATTREVTA